MLIYSEKCRETFKFWTGTWIHRDCKLRSTNDNSRDMPVLNIHCVSTLAMFLVSRTLPSNFRLLTSIYFAQLVKIPRMEGKKFSKWKPATNKIYNTKTNF